MKVAAPIVAAALLLVPASALSAPDSESVSEGQQLYQEAVQAELEVVRKTQGLLADKLEVRAAEMKTRVRALYKLSRASFPRLWLEPDERRRVSQWLGAARKITTRDKNEIRLLQEEIDVANTAEARLRTIQGETLTTSIAKRSLRSPLAKTKIVQGYGEFRGPTRRIRLQRRGIGLQAEPGEEVYAPASGRILYVGPIAGLGQALIVEHEGFSSIIGHVVPEAWSIGDDVAENTVIAHATDLPLYFELRLTIGTVGQVVDPTHLLAR